MRYDETSPEAELEVTLTYADMLAAMGGLLRLSGVSTHLVALVPLMGALSLVTALILPGPLDPAHLTFPFVTLTLSLLGPLVVWWQHRSLTPEARTIHLTVTDGGLDYRLGRSGIHLAFEDVERAAWTAKSLALKTRQRVVVIVPRRVLSADLSRFLAETLLPATTSDTRARRRGMLGVVALWLLLVVGFTAYFTLTRPL